uniref:RNI-like superfamily protein n=1 Tax=Macrostomum lignano TaxID=282301 RepID=A0A1I8JRK3_9PLAT
APRSSKELDLWGNDIGDVGGRLVFEFLQARKEAVLHVACASRPRMNSETFANIQKLGSGHQEEKARQAGGQSKKCLSILVLLLLLATGLLIYHLHPGDAGSSVLAILCTGVGQASLALFMLRISLKDAADGPLSDSVLGWRLGTRHDCMNSAAEDRLNLLASGIGLLKLSPSVQLIRQGAGIAKLHKQVAVALRLEDDLQLHDVGVLEASEHRISFSQDFPYVDLCPCSWRAAGQG